MTKQQNDVPQPDPAPEVRDAMPDELEDPAYWDDVYVEYLQKGEKPGFDLGEPCPELAWQLANAKPRISPGHVIVLGCGLGNDALLFAQHGFAVTAVDYAAHAVEGTRKNADAAGLPLTVLQEDLFRLPHSLDGQFDFVVEHTCFCAVHPTRRSDYASVAARLLKPGGQVLGIFYNHGRPGGPPYHTPPEEVMRAFSPYFFCRTLIVAQRGVERRLGNELYGRFWRR